MELQGLFNYRKRRQPHKLVKTKTQPKSSVYLQPYPIRISLVGLFKFVFFCTNLFAFSKEKRNY